jgi:hypothetical protein
MSSGEESDSGLSQTGTPGRDLDQDDLKRTLGSIMERLDRFEAMFAQIIENQHREAANCSQKKLGESKPITKARTKSKSSRQTSLSDDDEEPPAKKKLAKATKQKKTTNILNICRTLVKEGGEGVWKVLNATKTGLFDSFVTEHGDELDISGTNISKSKTKAETIARTLNKWIKEYPDKELSDNVKEKFQQYQEKSGTFAVHSSDSEAEEAPAAKPIKKKKKKKVKETSEGEEEVKDDDETPKKVKKLKKKSKTTKKKKKATTDAESDASPKKVKKVKKKTKKKKEAVKAAEPEHSSSEIDEADITSE